MLSLEKATTPEQVAAFFARFPGPAVVVMPKLDGLSLALVYEGGRLARAVTRGDGTTGDDVTVLVRALADGVPDAIGADGRVEVRGELVMLRSTFAAYNAAHPDKPLINPRGAAAGHDPRQGPRGGRGAPAAVLRLRPRRRADGVHADVEAGLRTLGFEAAEMRHCDDAAAAQAVIAAIEAGRNELDYDVDGAVLRLADRNAYAAAGTRANSPRGALAFKYAAEEKTTVLADVVWDVGKIGKVAPVAVLEPVFVGGTTVTRATLANQAVIRARDVRIGDTVLVRRAGDVIPFVAGVLDAAKRTGAEREIVPPETCPSCAQPLTEQGASRELYCTNVACPAQTVRRLIHWASRAAADIEAVGPVWIERLSEAGLLERPSDFYALGRDDLLRLRRHRRGVGRRACSSRSATAAASACAARWSGSRSRWPPRRTAARLCRAGFRSARGGRRRRRGGAQQVEDIGPKVAASLHEHLNRAGRARRARPAARARRRPRRARRGPARRRSPPTRRWPARPSSSRARSPTRAAARRSRGRPSSACASARAPTTASSVSANTDLLICGANVGAAKTAKAEKLGVEIAGQDEIWRLLIAAGVA